MNSVYARGVSFLIVMLAPVLVIAADLSPGIALVEEEKWAEAKSFFEK